jgi:RNA polymerase sigma factor for flagellar operon FliA
LVQDNLDLVRRAAALIFPRVRGHVAFEELVAIGNAGLAEAAQRYDPARGVAFATFAWYRVSGAIVDELRRATQLPRRTWARLTALRAAGAYLEQEVGRGAPARETALAELQRAMSAIRTMYVLSLEALRAGGFDAEGDAAAPGDRLDATRLTRQLGDALAALPERERALLQKHYFEDKSLTAAGAELGMSKSWASRTHAQAIDRLRAKLAR